MSRVLLRCQADSSTALEFFNWVKNDLDQKPSTQNYCIIIHILAWSKNFKQAMEVLLELVELKRNMNSSERLTVFKILLNCTDECNWDPVVFDMLIKAYLKKGMVQESFRAFRKMVKLGFVPSTITINCLLNGISRMNCGEKCWEIYEEMVRIGAHPNSCTFNILTHVLCKEGDVNKVNEFLERMEEEGFDPDVVTYNMLIDSYCKRGRLKDAVYMYNIMYLRGVMPDLITHTTLINGLCKGGNAREAHRLLHQMIHRGLKPDVFSYNTLICGYCKEGMMQEARSLVLDMIDCGVTPDSFTCWILVKGYHGQDRLISAMNLVVELLRLSVSISRYIFDYLIFALCKENRPFAAKSFLERISRDGYEPNADIYNELIDSLCKSSSFVEEAQKLKVQMVAKDMKPNLCAYRAIIRSLCGLSRSKEAESLMREMVESGFQPDIEICRALMNGHCKEKNFHDAESLLASLSKEFQIFDAECYNALVRLLSEETSTTALMEFQDRMMKHFYNGIGGGGDNNDGSDNKMNNKDKAFMALAEASMSLKSLPKFGEFKERLLADDLFLAKVFIECGVGLFTKVAGAVRNRSIEMVKALYMMNRAGDAGKKLMSKIKKDSHSGAGIRWTSKTQIKFQLTEKKLSNCLLNPRVRRWCAYDWFYSAIDYPWFAKQEFAEHLYHVECRSCSKINLCGSVIRISLGKPRQFSEHFLKEEKEKLNQYRIPLENIALSSVKVSGKDYQQILHDPYQLESESFIQKQRRSMMAVC
ncbi:unnamed protein product [Fraxinus pennsylvanica]|uniref:DIRP domain-containing protein n=1 Tax=Fraxinus pennsylvanica TaxID=56036 RepID=A0AAD1Z3V2_9LAMI|nr:unnamed protein product [Fraxinus pennsylvanica]